MTGVKLVACAHITTETANLARTLQAGGAESLLIASNPLSTQDDVAASLVADWGIPVMAIKGESTDTYVRHVKAALETNPNLIIDDGSDVVATMIKEKPELIRQSHRHDRRDDDRHRSPQGDGQRPACSPSLRSRSTTLRPSISLTTATARASRRSTASFARPTFCSPARTLVVVGYGWCGKGVAMRARGMGANVVVTEIDPIKAIEAVMDGFRVMPMTEAAKIGDFFVTVTGNRHVIDREHFEVMKDGAIVCNSGHFDLELNLDALREMSEPAVKRRPFVEEYISKDDGKSVIVLGEGRLINLAAAEGHPAIVMDMSFANQALSAEYLVKKKGKLAAGVHVLPPEVDQEIASPQAARDGHRRSTTLTPEMLEYMTSWETGTSS